MMINGPAIMAGYQYRIRLALKSPVAGQAPPAMFPTGCALRAQVRLQRDGAVAIGELTTADDSIERISDTEIDLIFPPELTAQLSGHAHLDLVRTDTTPDEHLNIYLRIPVRKPVTVAA